MDALVAAQLLLSEQNPRQKLIARTRKCWLLLTKPSVLSGCPDIMQLKNGILGDSCIATKFLSWQTGWNCFCVESEELELNSCFLGEFCFLVILSAILVECYECNACMGLWNYELGQEKFAVVVECMQVCVNAPTQTTGEPPPTIIEVTHCMSCRGR